MNTKTLTFLFTICMSCTLARAQDPVDTPTALPTAVTADGTPRPNNLRIVEWELQMAESNYSLNPSNGNRSRLLMGLERFIVAICMPTLNKEIRHKSIPDTEECRRSLAALLSLDAENPVALCARDGVDSKSCAEASRNQDVEPYTLSTYRDSFSGNPETSEMDLAFKLSSEKVAEKIADVQTELAKLAVNNLATFTPAPSSPEDQIKRRGLYRKYLLLSCSMWRVAFVRRKLDSYAASETKGPRGIDQLKAEISKLAGDAEPTVTPTPAQTVGTRIRYISRQCETAATSAMREMPDMALPYCLKYGAYSVDCVKARRKELLLPKPGGTAASSSGSSRSSGLEEF